MNREKQVSVRFAAVGGNATKAEMRGIGLAGREAMQEIGQSSNLAEAGIEGISAAAIKARMDLETMATKAAMEARNMRTTIPAVSDVQSRIMQSTGVDRGISAADALRQGQALDDLRAKMNPLYNEIRRYKQAVSEVRSAHLEGAISAEEQAAAIARLRTSSLQAIDSIKGISAANREAARAAEEAAKATAREAQQLSDLRARYNPVYAATRQYKAALEDLNRLKRQGVISSQEYSDALDREAARMKMNIAATSAATTQMARSARMGTFRMQQMFYQVNDIGVSLAGGMNPFLVLAQQGTQVAQIYGFGNGGVSGVFKDLGSMIRSVVTRFPLVTAAVVATGAAVAGMTHEINQTTDVAVGLQDTFLAVFQVIGRGIARWIKPATDKIAEWFDAAWTKVVDGVKWVGNAIIKGVQLMIADAGFAIGTIPDLFASAWHAAKAEVFYALNDMIVGISQFLNKVATGFNDVFGTSLSGPDLSGIATDMNRRGNDAMVDLEAAQNRIKNARDGYGARQEEIMASDPMGDFYDAVRKQAIENAKNRQEGDKKSGGRGGRGGRAQERDEIAELIAALKQELAVLRETDPIKKKMLEYSEQLAGATDQERAMVQGLVEVLDKAKNGWEAVGRSLSEYAQEAKRIGDDIGEALVSAFSSAEDAVGDFVKNGKLSFSDLVSSLIADLAKLATRKFITGPLSAGLGAAMDGIGGGGGFGAFWANFKGGFNSYDGGGHTGYGARSGGLDGRGGFLAMMHPQERVYDEARGQHAPAPVSPTIINFNGVRDVESFRRSRSQIAADMQRGLSAGRRTM
ncbi:phage tail tape measure C-terminal domain-containing protein [Sulfitobacter sp. 1A12126]|uniref:phage tail tape measure C-terminal domain-containing protein n=1 Tax=Sulfitobacter sp. 1A12126 TaxID=3368591 RepID=UPI0037470FCD